MKMHKTIMIVYEDKLVCGAFQGLLELYGHTILCCHNGLDAVSLSKEHDFDIILTDYDLPGIKGDEVCRLIRVQRPHAYIVGLSIDSRDRDFMDAGADYFIFKDYLVQNFSLLHTIIQRTMKSSIAATCGVCEEDKALMVGDFVGTSNNRSSV